MRDCPRGREAEGERCEGRQGLRTHAGGELHVGEELHFEFGDVCTRVPGGGWYNGPGVIAVGEVRARVRLTNRVDETLARRGMIKPEEVRRCEADALVGTGAVRSVRPPHVVERLGLGLRGRRVAEYADGRKDVVGITEPLVVEIEGRGHS